jgi:PadR family transcriptional regulator, regulatory protein PadR
MSTFQRSSTAAQWGSPPLKPEARVSPCTHVRFDLQSAHLLSNLHMARADALQGALPLLVLKILVRRGPLHGYAITTQIESMSDVLRVEEGSLYPALHRMEEAGWVKARWVVTDNKRRARLYEVTVSGRRQLETEEVRWRAVTLAVGHVLERI